MNAKILPGLDQIDWVSMSESQMPQWVRALASNDKNERLKAYNNLEHRLTLLGSESWESYGPLELLMKNDAPLLIVPFFVELLQRPDLESKVDILQLLCDLANYVTLEASTAYKIRVWQVFDSVNQGKDVYMGLADDSNPTVSTAAVFLLEQLSKNLN